MNCRPVNFSAMEIRRNMQKLTDLSERYQLDFALISYRLIDVSIQFKLLDFIQ